MKAFDELLEIAKTLNGPNGCPWDLKQTFKTLQPYVVEEAHEVIEAVDSEDDSKIIEELGDLLYTIVFYATLAEKQGRFGMIDVLKTVSDKLIRRHPHIFADEKVQDADEVLKRWEMIKKEEKAHADRESALDGIPVALPAIARAQKVIKRIMRAQEAILSEKPADSQENKLGWELIQAIIHAEKNDLDAESVLRRTLHHYESLFRTWEKKNS
jgi:uncharacterized protein YabN with tetrapyrrole methylase and pyrophosphatase domain